MASFSGIGSKVNCSLPGALNLSLPKKQRSRAWSKKIQMLAGKDTDLKLRQLFAEEPDEFPPGLSLPDGLTPPLRLAPPPGLECSNCSDDVGSDGCIDFGARSTTGSGLSDREETDPEVEEFQIKADAAMMQLQSLEFCKMIRSPNKPVVTVDCPDTRISLNADALPFVPSFLSESPQTKPKANKVHRNGNAPCFAPGQPEVPGRSGSFLALAQREGWLDSKLKTPIQSPLRKVVIEDTYSMSPSKSPYKATGMKRTAEHRRHLAPVMKIGVNFSV